MNPAHALDPAALERLRRLGGDAFARKMIDLFLGFAAERITAARVAHSAGNLAAVADAVHPIKSSAGNIGAGRVQELAARLEQLARQQPTESMDSLLAELEHAFAAASAELETARQTLAPAPAANASGPPPA